MSKSLQDLARVLAASNEELFDRYINVRLCRKETTASSGFSVFSNTSLSKAWEVMNAGVSINDLDFQIVCPKSGLKPDITVTGQWLISNTVNNITITIRNIDANIDTMAYNFAQVDMGYYNSGIHISFMGQITNCYMAKPNPNGELVITVVSAPVSSLYAQGDFEVSFATDTVITPELILTCVDAMCKKYPQLTPYCKNVVSTIPITKDGWWFQTFTVGKGTRHFRSCMECITWLNSLFATFTIGTGFASAGINTIETSAVKLEKALPPLKLGFSHSGDLLCRCSYSEATPMTVKALHAIGSAMLTSENATVTAPFNPDVLPGDVVYIDARYFRTRVNVDSVREAYKKMGSLWYVIQVQFVFSTSTTNTMTLLLNNIQNKISAREG